MNNRLLFVLLVQIACFPLFGQDTQAAVNHENDDKSVSLEVTQGYRRDTIKQHLKYDHLNHIKRKFKDLSIYQTRLGATASCDDWFTKAQVGYGDVLSGKVRMNASGAPQIHGKVPHGYTLNAELQVGKSFALTQEASLSPFVGYLWDMERLHGKKYQVSGHKAPYLKTKDTFHWNAPFIGIAAAYNVANVDLYGSYKFLFALQEHANFKAKHLGKSHYTSKRPKGFGNVGTIGAGYNFAKNWAVKTEYELSSIHTRGGSIKSHKHNAVHHTKTNKLSSEIRLCLDYAF